MKKVKFNWLVQRIDRYSATFDIDDDVDIFDELYWDLLEDKMLEASLDPENYAIKVDAYVDSWEAEDAI